MRALTEAQREALRRAIAPFAEQIERIDLFGPRARGDHRPGSDVDLLGSIDGRGMTALHAAIDGSDLSISFDLHHYCDIAGTPLATIAGREAIPLFTQAELVTAAR